MSEKSKASGEHPSVVEFRKKLDSINETTLPEAARTIERIETALSAAPPVLTTPVPAVPLMGKYVITIQGEGRHHNGILEDADRLTARFVQQLRAMGHNVSHAAFTNGDEENITQADAYLAEGETGESR